MAASDDLIDFDIIEAQKENVQSLPGGRSARQLAQIFSAGSNSDKIPAPSPNDTRTINGAIRQEYETELESIAESDDPLDVYDRYVKWTLNAYPSAQATPESGLLPLLERATKSFLSSSHYKNDPRYLKLWLHYIRLFSDAPRETFAFLSRHHIGEGLALFYEEFAAWLEGAGRWNQADEVYRLGMDREARPAERLLRKYSEFQQRYEAQQQDAGPSSPALPVVRPALAAKMDPFAPSDVAEDPQASQQSRQPAAAPKTKSGKPKMAIFSDADVGASSQPAVSGGETKGWESIGSMRERKKENEVEAKPWVGETLKAGKKSGPIQKMAIFRDESNPNPPQEKSFPKQVPEHHVREAVNQRTGRRERVFVDLESVYPDRQNPTHEVSFEELRAMRRGWMNKNWRTQKEPLKQISGNATGADSLTINSNIADTEEDLPEQLNQKLSIDGQQSRQIEQDAQREAKAAKSKKFKVHGDTQTVKMKFDSPSSSKVRRKSTREPTMTMHTRAATDEIYSIFNQPLKAEEEDAADSLYGSEYEDYDTGDSTGTGHISAASSDFGDEETQTFHKSFDDTEYADTTRAESVVGDDWTEFTARDVPGVESADGTSHSVVSEDIPEGSQHGTPEKERFVPQMPEDYNPPCGTYRDPAIMAQNRLPFMTPIVERTESSISMTAARNTIYNAKTPTRPRTPSGVPQMGDLLLSSPLGAPTPYHGDNTISSVADVPFSPTAFRALAPKPGRREATIRDLQCNPTDKGIRNTILNSLEPPLATYAGYHGHVKDSNYASMIQKFVKAHSRKSRAAAGDDEEFDTPILEFPGAERSYIIRRELGAGAYAPVYLAESVDSLESYDSDSGAEDTNPSSLASKINPYDKPRYQFEAVKVEKGPSSAWEFYMIRAAYERLRQSAGHARATDSIVRAHELHVHQRESFLVEDYRGQGTLLDLVNIVRNEHNSDSGLEESLAMFFSIELFRAVEGLHANGILHGDIKADNCLVRLDEANSNSPPEKSLSLLDLDANDSIPDERDSIYYSPSGLHGWRNKGLSLIDFGRGIDMHAFQPNVQFIADWETGTHECNEIREMRPWTHQIDLYGIADTIHVLLFGKYIESCPVRTSGGAGSPGSRTYRIRESLKRYWDRALWSDVFDLLLNPSSERWVAMEREDREDVVETESGAALPVLASMRFVRRKMEDWLVAHAEKKGLALQLRKIEAILSERKKKLERS
ncbi:hypothetical protein N7532_003204 [Penicillium argentinense]|uniref:Uncharacterized protein n=1 Tax=Penicillium argentinense TaxID=1131581 RepID=A0A9W9KDP3_9EURO|nr:uncharacterized protein N7532_003204 [Penicillium argentinense]KAJ5102675.1 hypothetical protein N7532_003204 [Penicillium argentinense]